MTNAAVRSRTTPGAQNENATEAPTEAPKTGKEKDTVSIAFQVPVAMKTQLEAYADAQKVTIAKVARGQLAGLIDFDISGFETQTRTRSSKYNTPEEREAAKKAKSKERSDTIKLLMEKLKKGEITL